MGVDMGEHRDRKNGARAGSFSRLSLIDSHFHNLAHGEFENEVRRNYCDDALLMTAHGIFRGPEQIIEGFKRLRALHVAADFHFEVIEFTEDLIFLESRLKTASGETFAICESVVLKGGRIFWHSLHVLPMGTIEVPLSSTAPRSTASAAH
jgi:hypothetical protein